jgi:hypothetical protein
MKHELRAARVTFGILIAVQALNSVAGAINLYAAIDLFLVGHAVRSAMHTALAFYCGTAFVRDMDFIAHYRKLIADLSTQQ